MIYKGKNYLINKNDPDTFLNLIKNVSSFLLHSFTPKTFNLLIIDEINNDEIITPNNFINIDIKKDDLLNLNLDADYILFINNSFQIHKRVKRKYHSSFLPLADVAMFNERKENNEETNTICDTHIDGA